MSTDIQYFTEDGTWVKPPGAVRVEVTLKGGDGGISHAYVGAHGSGYGGAGATASGYMRASRQYQSGEAGGTVTQSFAADDLPDLVEVEVGHGGRPGGRDGYARIVTHLTGGTDAPDH